MLKDGQRMCDVCGEHIPKGKNYRRITTRAETAALLSAPDDADLIPTWTPNDDGSVTMEICLECTISMGTVAPEGSSH